MGSYALYEKLVSGEAKLSVIGLGYVGMPLAIAFAKKIGVIGFDLSQSKLQKYLAGIDPTGEVGDDAVQESSMAFTADETRLQAARFHIIAVPTPINQDKTPDLAPVISASTILGRNLSKNSIVVYESTVYPGVTEDICIPVLERESGLRCGRDFKIGYSPERINPGDREHRLENIRKIVSGMDADALDEISKVYEMVISAGVYRASSIKVAEAAKVVENSQRDINIAFMNELAMVFDRMHIDTNEVVEAMNTKWNALGFRPGLVGGHCIGVDPYYFVYEAEKLGYHSQIVIAGRRINDGMGSYVADAAIKQMILAGQNVVGANVVILGITFKENCPDTRNSKVADIVARLREYRIEPRIVDPCADPEETMREYEITLTAQSAITNADCVIFAVAHRQFKTLVPEDIDRLFADRKNNGGRLIIDVKGILDRQALTSKGYRVWRL